MSGDGQQPGTTLIGEVPLVAADLATPDAGLDPRPGPRKRVIVIGGGLAGLVAAFELARQGHEPIVLEAQHRVGGRVYTLRNFAPGLYAEAGAMRIPRIHDLTLRYCELFGLELRPFMMGNPRGLVVVGGERMTTEQAALHPERLPFELAEHERGRRFADLWAEATRDLREMLERDGAAAWDEIVREYDQYSLREFLVMKGFSEGAIEMYGVMNFVESDMNNAVVEELREDLGKAFEDMQEIVGGMDRLPNGFFARLQDRVRFGAEVHAIAQDPDSVTVHFKTEAGRYSVTGDYAICAIPFSVLRHIEVLTPFSREKQRAIRQLNYAVSTKILFQVSDRIWEAEDGIFGGATVTDLPIRRMNYPTPDPTTRRGGPPGKLHVVAGRRAMGRHGRRQDSRRRCRTSPGSTRGFGRSTRRARPTPGTTIATPTGPSPSLRPSSRRRSRRTLSSRRAGSTSPGSTARSTTPGSRERLSRGSTRLVRSTSGSTRGSASAARLAAVEVGRVPLHDLGHCRTRSSPVGLISEDDAVRAPAADLGHGVDDCIMGERASTTRLDLPGHEVSSDDVKRRGPAADPDGVALSQGFEPIVVADRMPVVVGLVADEIHAVAGSIEAGQPPVVGDCLVTHRARRQLDVGGRRLPVRESTAATECRLASTGGRPAPKTGRLDQQGQCAAPLVMPVSVGSPAAGCRTGRPRRPRGRWRGPAD